MRAFDPSGERLSKGIKVSFLTTCVLSQKSKVICYKHQNQEMKTNHAAINYGPIK